MHFLRKTSIWSGPRNGEQPKPRVLDLQSRGATFVEKVPTAIIDEVTPKGGVGRTRHDAPEIDGNIILSSRKALRIGDIVTAKVKRADAYDLHGSVI